MRRIIFILAIGLVCAAIGTIGVLNAHSLSTRWESSQGVSWGYSDPAKEVAYRIIGSAFLVFGLGMVALASHRWMPGRSPSTSKPEWTD